MKKFLLVIIFCFLIKAGYSQSLSFSEMLNLTGMNDGQAHDFLISKGFKQQGTQVFSGKTYDQYESNRTADKAEYVYVGSGSKTPGGGTQRPISYSTVLGADMDNLLAQAKKSTLTLIFQGADVSKNIFRFDNSLFRASISVAFDKKSGAVDISQKENAGN